MLFSWRSTLREAAARLMRSWRFVKKNKVHRQGESVLHDIPPAEVAAPHPAVTAVFWDGEGYYPLVTNNLGLP